MTTKLDIYRDFMGPAQREAIREACMGEEGAYFSAKLRDILTLIEGMPKTYEQDGLGMQAIAHLHYFTGSCDWYIAEKDVETPDESGQHQAFGWADLGYGGELGYISITELIANGAELDLYFTPKPLAVLVEREQQAA